MTRDEKQEARAMVDEAAMMGEALLDAWRSLSWLQGRCGEIPELAEVAPFFGVAAAPLLDHAEKIARAGERLKTALALASTNTAAARDAAPGRQPGAVVASGVAA